MRLFCWCVALLLLVSVLPFSGTAVASDSRLDALGVQYEYMEDYELFRFFPTVAARYGNLVTVSLGGRDSDSGRFGEDYSVGVIGSGDDTSYGTFAVYLNNVGDDAQFDITWARQFSGYALGLGFLWQNSSVETGQLERSPIDGLGAGNRVLGTNQFSVVGGANFDVGGSDQLEIAAELASLYWNYTGADGSVLSEDAGQLTYRLTARMMRELSSRTTLVPLVGYTHLDLTPEGADDHYINTFNFGVAMHHEVNDNDLLVMGIAANYRKSMNLSGSVEEFSRWDLPALFAALEFQVTDWLTGRAGATKTLDVTSSTYADPQFDGTDTMESRYHFGLGAGVHFENFDVDLTLNPDALFSGGYLVSGEETRPVTRITATYFF